MARYCTRCGTPLTREKRFCTSCGFPVDSISSEMGKADGSERKSNRGSQGWRVLGVVSLSLALLVIGVGIFALVNGGIDATLARLLPQPEAESVVATCEFGSLGSVKVAESTRVVPQISEEISSASSYRVRIKQADDSSGAFVRVDDLPILSVTGTEGFSLADFGSLVSGVYYLSIESESGTVLDLPPLALADSDSLEVLPEELDVSMPADVASDSVLTRRGKYGTYLDMLETLVKSYGEPSLTVMRLNDEQHLVWVAGVSYAGLVDFGDGAERLVVMYCLDGGFARSDIVEIEEGASAVDFGPAAGDYCIEIYEYDLIADEAVMVCQTTPEVAEDGRATLRYVKGSEDHAFLVADGESEGKSGCYGIDGVGSFGLLSKGIDMPLVNGYRFFNAAKTQEKALTDAGDNEMSCEETAQSTKDLIVRLEALSSW